MPTAGPSTLSQLADSLRAQAKATGTISLDNSFLPPRALALIKSELGRLTESLTLTSVGPASVTLSADESTLKVTGAKTGATKPETALNLLSVGADLVVQQTLSSGEEAFDLILRFTLPEGWGFGQSFRQLVLSPFDNPDYVSFNGPRFFYFSTFTSLQPLPDLPPPPAPGGTAILQTGLNFYADLTFGGLFQLVSGILPVRLPSLPCFGPIVQTANGPTLDLKAHVAGVSSIDFGFITVQAPWLGLSNGYYVPTADGADRNLDPPATAIAQPMLYLGTTIDLGGALPLTIEAGLNSGSDCVQLSITDSQGLTLPKLAEALMGSTANDLLGLLPSDLQTLLNAITLTRFNAGFDILPSPRLRYVHVTVATSPAWPLFGDHSISLSLDWLIQLSGAKYTFVTLAGEFVVKPGKLSFDIRISIENGAIQSITGSEHGEINLSLAELDDAFGGGLGIPPDLLKLSLADFTVSIDKPTSSYDVSGMVSASLSLFGTQILGIEAAQVLIHVDNSGETEDYTVSINGYLSLGPITANVDATIGKTTDTVLTMNLVDETVGSMLGHLVHLVDPNYDISLGEPWDKILDISLDAFVLSVTLPAKGSKAKPTVSLTYNTHVDLEFLTLSAITLTYSKPPAGSAASSVHISIDGSFLGQSFSEASGNPLKWDALNESPPSIPGKGPQLFDLEYIGLGQHVALSGPDLTTVEKVMAALRNSVIPIEAGALPPFGQPGGISFSAESDWLIGAQFSVMDTVAISAIFNDPNLYGILLTLSGEKAKIFAGLRFEILYRKVTDSIGVYHIEFTLPDAMRHLEFGEVSITLPVLVLDIYTNGNFRVDLGFPTGLDFSNSFSVQVFPFVGFGGFYFALLDGATSSRVPQITNGSFSPVIEFGIALSLGVGKTIDEGILQGGISVTVVGVLQGVLGWFHPTDASPKDTYYWIQGTVSVVGKLYATIDFAIIQASLDVTAYISVTLTIESYQPIYIEATASVSVSVSVKIVFFTIHLSFSTTVDASFTIGSASTPPWKIAAGGASSDGNLRRLRGQRTLHAPAYRHGRFAKALRRALLPEPPAITAWPAACVLGSVRTVPIWAMPTFTKSETQPAAAEAVVLLAAENSIDPGASTRMENRIVHGAAPQSAPFNLLMEAMLRWAILAATSQSARITADQLADLRTQLLNDDTVAAAFDYVTLTQFLAANFVFQVIPAADQVPPSAIAAAPAGAVRADGVTTITTTAPHGLATGDSAVIAGVADSSFEASGPFTITATSATTLTYAQPALGNAASGGGTVNKAAGVAMFPMIPEIALSDTDGTQVRFASFNMVGTDYQEKVRAYFQILQAQFDARNPGGKGAPEAVGAAPGVSIAKMIFSRYFNMLMSAGVKAAIDLMAEYPYTIGAPASMADIDTALGTDLVATPLQVVAPNQSKAVLAAGARLQLPEVVHQVRLGETFAAIAAALGPGALDPAGNPYAAAALIAANRDARNIFNTGTATWAAATAFPPARASGVSTLTTAVPHGLVAGNLVTVSGIGDPSFNGSFLVASTSETAFTYAQTGQPDATSTGGSAAATIGLRVSGLGYASQAGDTLGLIAMRLGLRTAPASLAGGISGLSEAVQALLAIPANAGITDPNKVIDPAAIPTVALAGGGSYAVVAGDTLTLIAGYFLAIAQRTLSTDSFLQALHQLNPGLPTDPTVPLAAGTALALPPLARAFEAGDTIASLAATLIAPAEAIEAALAAMPAGLWMLAPQAVLRVPLLYEVQAADTFSGIAARFNLTLQDVADGASLAPGLFAQGATVLISDLPSIEVDTLIGQPSGTGLLGQAEWNNASGMVSRFLLSGLRLPDPNDAYFQSLTLQDLQDPAKLGAIVTRPLFALTGQQYPFGGGNPSSYQITLTNASQAGWLAFGSGQSATFNLTANEIALEQDIVSTPLDPQMQPPQRMALFRMVPPRIPLQNHLAWQAAILPAGPLSAGGATGNPSIWLLPDTLMVQIAAARHSPLLYEVVTAKRNVADQTASAEQADPYAWAAIVDLAISLPETDGPAPSVANAYVLDGADDAGAALLQQIHACVSGGQKASLYLLYSPSPTSRNASGLVSDSADPKATCLIKANLSTLTHGGGGKESFVLETPTDTLAASLADTAAFLALAWEASITRSGGFYLNYVNRNGGGGFPAGLFGNSKRATVSLLVVLDSQAASRDAPILPLNNCVIVGGNIDTTVTGLFVQPATATVQPGDSIASVRAGFNKAWSTHFSVLDVATLNADVPLLLQVGAVLAIPDQNDYSIAYGDTLASIVAKPALKLPSLAALIGAGSNATAPILARGAQMQLAGGVLRPVTTVPAGTVGFEITRTNPDPDNLPHPQLPAAAVVSQLFNLVGFQIAAGNGFIASGAGLPTTPAESLSANSDGLGGDSGGNDVAAEWYYHQTLTVGPFATVRHGSASPALPAAKWNPYNGVGYDQSVSRISTVAIALCALDIYGNAQQLAPPGNSVSVPVGYFDDLVGLGGWPSLGIAYAIAGTPPGAPTIGLAMTMQQARYVPSLSVPVPSALAAIQADLASYRRIYYQLAQPDVTFALETTLDPGNSYALPKAAFAGFARGAYVYLSALATLKAVRFTVPDAATSVAMIVARYGVTAAQLFEANRNQLYAKVFPASPPLAVPKIYTALAGDSLTSIVNDPCFASYHLDVATLARSNEAAPLAAGIELATPARVLLPAAILASPGGAARTQGVTTITTAAPHGFAAGDAITVAGVKDASFNGPFIVSGVAGPTLLSYAQAGGDAQSDGGTVSGNSLANAARRARCSPAALAAANAGRPGLLQAGIYLNVGTQSYQLAEGDSFAIAAQALKTNVEAVATANQNVADLLVPGVSLNVATVLAGNGDDLTTLALSSGQTVEALAGFGGNDLLASLFAAGTAIVIGTNPKPIPPAADDTITLFAQANGISVDELAAANAGSASLFAAGAALDIPSALTNSGADQYCTYSAGPADSLATIAARFGITPAALVALNPDLDGLIVPGQTVTDTASGKAVTTIADDSFAAINVNVSLDQLAADVAGQDGLAAPGGLWICPPMTGGANGGNPSYSLAGLAQAYRTDALTVATANAAVIGFLQPKQPLTLGGVPIETGDYETFNSLQVRAAAGGAVLTLAEIVDQLAAVAGLIAPDAQIVPVPPPTPAGNQAVIAPSFPNQVFPVAVTVAAARNPDWIDPDFRISASVATARFAIPPGRDGSAGALGLGAFATAAETALPGLHLATADPTEMDPSGSSPLWGVNFGSPYGPAISYSFDGAGAQYFALPPLSTSLMAGRVPVQAYVSGEGLAGEAQLRSFQAVDLDVWLNGFLEAVDLFLSPAYAVPAYGIDPAHVVAVIEAKQALAQALSRRLACILADQDGGTIADAQYAFAQALLQRLSNAFTVNAVVQVPVTVSSVAAGGHKVTDPRTAPRLSGKAFLNPGGDPTISANAFSLSAAKVSLTDSCATAPNASFLFSVKAPAQHKNLRLDIDYLVTELELPDPAATIGDYKGSSWLTFVHPLDRTAAGTGSTIGPIDVPVPLRSYPSPVTLVSQSARQAVAAPAGAADLLPWNFDFVYQHADAEQDTPLVSIGFNDPPAPEAKPGEASAMTALAQFMSAWPALKDDLAYLPLMAPGNWANPSAIVTAAIATFAGLVEAVAPTLAPAPPPKVRATGVDAEPQPESHTYQLQSAQSADGKLTTLTVTSVDLSGNAVPNTNAPWPTISVLVEGRPVPLVQRGTPTATQAVYAYPGGLDADQPQSRAFLFGEGVPAPQSGSETFSFCNPDIFARQTGRAGVAIARNLALLPAPAAATNPAFVYRTPFAFFTSDAVASVTGAAPIAIGAGPAASVGQALTGFFRQLLTSDAVVPIRFGAAYSFRLCETAAAEGSTSLAPAVPILLVPSYQLDPTQLESFTSQIEAALENWATLNAPLAPGGAFLFDLVVYAGPGGLRQLIHASCLQYSLTQS